MKPGGPSSEGPPFFWERRLRPPRYSLRVGRAPGFMFANVGSGDAKKGEKQNVRNHCPGRLCSADDRRHAYLHPQGDQRREFPCGRPAHRSHGSGHEHRRHLDLGAVPVHIIGNGLHKRRAGNVLVSGAECAVPHHLHPICQENPPSVPGWYHPHRLHGRAVPLPEGQGRLLLPAGRAGRPLDGRAAARRREDAGPPHRSAFLEHDACSGRHRLFLLPFLRHQGVGGHGCRPAGHHPLGRCTPGGPGPPADQRPGDGAGRAGLYQRGVHLPDLGLRRRGAVELRAPDGGRPDFRSVW